MPDRSVVVRLIADTSSYSDNMRRAGEDTRGVGEAGDETSSKLEGLKGVLAGIGAGAILKTGVDLNALKQNATAAFTTLSGSAKAANAELDSLQRDFGSNPFGFETIVKAGQRLTAMGVPLQNVNKMLMNISDATAAVGGDAEVFDRISMSIGQMLSKGTVQSEEMLQLAEAGIPAWQLLAKEIGTTVPEAMKRVQNRQVDAQTAVDALMRGVENRFGGATRNAENTWTGMLAKLKSETAQAAGEIVAPLMRIASEGAEATKPLLQGVGEVGNAFAGLPSPMQNTALALGAVALFSGRLNGAWAAGRGYMTRFNEQMAVQRSLAAANGQQLGRLGSIAATTGARIGAGTRALSSAFGGPLGLAITGTVLALSMYQQSEQDAAKATAEHQAAVDALSNSLDTNTLKLTARGRAEQVDTFLTGKGNIDSRKFEPRNPSRSTGRGSNEFEDLTVVDALQKLKVNAELARQALSGNEEALARLGRQLRAVGGDDMMLALSTLTAITGQSNTLGEALDTTTTKMRLKIPEAAQAAGVSASTLNNALDRTAAGSGTMQTNLAAAGATAQQVAVIMGILTGSTQNAGAAALKTGSDFAAAQAAIAQAAGSFISITGAWDSAVQANTPKAGGGGGASAAPKQKPLPKLEDDKAYAKAKAAEDAFERAQKKQDRLDRERVRNAKKVAEADSEAADAASERARATREAADAAQDAARDAEDALKKAQDLKERSDRNARDAAALAAAVRDQASRAGTADRSAYDTAMISASAAASSTAATARSADSGAASAQRDFDEKSAAAKRAKARADADEAVVKAAKDRADRSRKIVDDLQDAIEEREWRTERVRDRLQARREKAEKEFNKRLDKLQKERDAASSTSNAGVAGGYDAMNKKVKVSLDDYLKQLRDQVNGQRKWKDDLLELSAKIPPGMAAELAKLGPEAAPLIASLNTGTKTQLREFVRLFGDSGTDAGTKLSNELTAAMPLVGTVAKTLGSTAATKLARAISEGKTGVNEAIQQLGANGLNLEAGLKNKRDIERWINSLDDKPIDLNAEMRINRVRDSKGQIVEVKFPTRVIARAKGGWVEGGSGVRDDVSIPLGRNPGGLIAMGGEYMVRKDIAQRNRPFFDQLDRTGRLPQQATSMIAPVIQLPPQAPARVVTNHITIVQRESQSMRDVFREVDRLADIGQGQ